MTERIAVGDLVQVVRWPCCQCDLGRIFRVKRLDRSGGSVQCEVCRKDHGDFAVYAEADHHELDYFPLEYLRRIPPLDEPAETYETDKLKEPA